MKDGNEAESQLGWGDDVDTVVTLDIVGS